MAAQKCLDALERQPCHDISAANAITEPEARSYFPIPQAVRLALCISVHVCHMFRRPALQDLEWYVCTNLGMLTNVDCADTCDRELLGPS